MLNADEQREFETLDEKSKTKKGLQPTERAWFSVLKKKLEASKKSATKNTVNSKCSNAFSKKESTTKVTAYSVRFFERELTGLQTIINSLIKGPNAEKIITELGSIDEINKTKLIRAAIHLLHDKTDDEIIQAIKDVRINMISTK